MKGKKRAEGYEEKERTEVPERKSKGKGREGQVREGQGRKERKVRQEKQERK